MESMQEEMDDSRISAVGRKRNLEELQGTGTSRHPSVEDDAQRATKRVKDDDEHLEDSIVEDGIILNTSSPLSVASSLPTESSQTLPATSQTPQTVIVPPPAGAWNRGVQSGVRTSFGSRAQAQPKSKSEAIIPSLRYDDGPSSNTIKANTNLPQNNTFNFSDQDEGAETGMAETVDISEVQTSVLPNLDEAEDVPMAATGILEMQTATTSEEEGEISSSRGTAEDADVRHGQPSWHFAQYAGGERSKGSVDNANSSQQQVSGIIDRYYGQSVGGVFSVDLQRRESAQRPSSSSPDADDMEDGSDADAAEIDPNPVSDTVNPPFKMLSHAEEAQLPFAEKSKYSKAKSDWLKEQKQTEKINSFYRLTAEAEAMLAHKGLPLPSKYSGVKDNIAAGLTFFPRKVDDNGPFYRKKKIDYTISEILNEGKPIRIQDLTIDIFATAFLKDNPEKWKNINPKVLSAAFSTYRLKFYDHHAIMLGSPNGSDKDHGADKTTVKNAIREATALLASISSRESPALPDNETELLSAGTTEINIDQVDIEQMERDLQAKYFPSTNDRPATYHCLACGDNSHMTLDCPSLTCTLCGGDHVQFACPKSRRCHKCRQRGHDVAQCPEKLALSKAEAIGCDFCGSTDHFEISCHTIWRTFHPKPQEIRKVREIPVHCYICGETGHYGPECGLYKECPLLSGGQTWSKENLLKYIDPTSADRAMSAGIDYSLASKPTKQFSIKGKANNPINLDDSDDEDITFLHEKVKGPKHHAQIKIAGTARLGQLPQEAHFPRAPNPPRDSRPGFGHSAGRNGPPGVDSARYGRERTFSPPPRFDDMRYDFPEAEGRYQPQPSKRENAYRLRPPQAHNNHQSAPQDSLPVRPPSNNSRGGRGGRGGRVNSGSNNTQGGGPGRAGGQQQKKKKRSDRSGGGSAGRGGTARRGN